MVDLSNLTRLDHNIKYTTDIKKTKTVDNTTREIKHTRRIKATKARLEK